MKVHCQRFACTLINPCYIMYSDITIAEAQRSTGENSWTLTLDELDEFIGLVIARGVLGARNFWYQASGIRRGVSTYSRTPFHVSDFFQ